MKRIHAFEQMPICVSIKYMSKKSEFNKPHHQVVTVDELLTGLRHVCTSGFKTRLSLQIRHAIAFIYNMYMIFEDLLPVFNNHLSDALIIHFVL